MNCAVLQAEFDAAEASGTRSESESAAAERALVSLAPLHTGKPLALEYMADRLDTDDPLRGYMIRTKREGWLQGK